MAAHLVRLKLTLLRNQLRGSTGQVLGLLLSMVFGLLGLLILVLVVPYLRGLPVDDAGTWVTAAGAVLLLAWTVSPLGVLGSDQTLDPARFVTFAVPSRQLATGLLVGSMVSVPAVVTAAAALGTVVVWARDPVSAVVALLSGTIGFVTCVVAARAAGTALAVLQGGRRLRELVVSLGIVLAMGVSFVPLMLSEGVRRLSAESLRPVVDAVALTPLGWLWSAPWDAANGAIAVAAGKLVLGAALVPLLIQAWAVMLRLQLVRPPVSGRATTRGRRTVLAVLPGPTGAVAERCLRYWRRDPRYTLSVVMVLVLPLLGLVLVAVGLVSLQTWALGVGPLVAYLLGWGLHNDLAYDADAWWFHLASHVPGRADRAGRVLASAVWGVPLLLVAAVGGVLLADRLAVLPAVVGMSAAVLGAGYGVSSVSAVIAPYWAPAPGENPRATPPGAGAQVFVSQLVAGAAMIVVAAPVAVPFFLAVGGSTTASWTALLLGLLLGGVLTVGGVVVGGRLLDRRGPELLATVRK